MIPSIVLSLVLACILAFYALLRVLSARCDAATNPVWDRRSAEAWSLELDTAIGVDPLFGDAEGQEHIMGTMVPSMVAWVVNRTMVHTRPTMSLYTLRDMCLCS